MVREYFIKYGEIEDLRVIVDKKKVNFKKYGFVLFKKGSSLNQVLEESLTHTIAPGVSVDCKQTLLREELKEKQLEIDQVRPMSEEERKQYKKDKKKIKKLSLRVEKLKQQGKEYREIENSIKIAEEQLKKFKS